MSPMDEYISCLKLRINKLRVMMEEDLKVWEDAVRSAERELTDYAQSVSHYMYN